MLIKKHSYSFAFLILASSFLTVGCRDTEEYQKVSQAGNAYISAVNALLDSSAIISIDTSSERLLASDLLSNIDQETYESFSDADLRWLSLLGQVRQHNQLLAEYFTLLGDLAGSDAPDRSKTAIESISENLVSIGGELSSNPNIASKLAGPVTRLVVSGQIRGALRDELEQRKDVIQDELILQEALLEVLAEQISDDLGQIRRFQEDRLIEEPLLAESPMSAAQHNLWIKERRRILLLQTTSDKLVAAKEASTKFRGLFEALIEDGLNIQRIDSFLEDIEEILKTIESTQESQSTLPQESQSTSSTEEQ